jgi:hypothetical protein
MPGFTLSRPYVARSPRFDHGAVQDMGIIFIGFSSVSFYIFPPFFVSPVFVPSVRMAVLVADNRSRELRNLRRMCLIFLCTGGTSSRVTVLIVH